MLSCSNDALEAPTVTHQEWCQKHESQEGFSFRPVFPVCFTMIICLGPVCIPLWQIVPFLYLLIKYVWKYIKSFFGYIEEEQKNPVDEAQVPIDSKEVRDCSHPDFSTEIELWISFFSKGFLIDESRFRVALFCCIAVCFRVFLSGCWNADRVNHNFQATRASHREVTWNWRSTHNQIRSRLVPTV